MAMWVMAVAFPAERSSAPKEGRRNREDFWNDPNRTELTSDGAGKPRTCREVNPPAS
jgi:hypothetical protein